MTVADFLVELDTGNVTAQAAKATVAQLERDYPAIFIKRAASDLSDMRTILNHALSVELDLSGNTEAFLTNLALVVSALETRLESFLVISADGISLARPFDMQAVLLELTAEIQAGLPTGLEFVTMDTRAFLLGTFHAKDGQVTVQASGSFEDFTTFNELIDGNLTARVDPDAPSNPTSEDSLFLPVNLTQLRDSAEQIIGKLAAGQIDQRLQVLMGYVGELTAAVLLREGGLSPARDLYVPTAAFAAYHWQHLHPEVHHAVQTAKTLIAFSAVALEE